MRRAALALLGGCLFAPALAAAPAAPAAAARSRALPSAAPAVAAAPGAATGAALPPPAPSADFEPPPSGELVRWAAPLGRRLSVKSAPARSSRTLGEVWAGSELVLGDGPPVSGRGGCTTWLPAQPAGYVCQAEVRLRRGPFPGPLDEADEGARRRYRYAVVQSERAAVLADPRDAEPARWLARGDGVTVIEGSGRALLRTTGHEWVRVADLAIAAPTRLRGLELRALPPPERGRVGWLVGGPDEESVPLRVPARVASAARPAVWELRLVPRYTPVVVLGAGEEGRVAVRALLAPGAGGEDAPRGEVSPQHLRRVLPAAPPPDLLPGERWIDVSLAEQVTVAYEGREPVFAALVSTAPHGGTPPGSYRVYRKYRTQTMANLAGSRSQYDFRQVPWAQFYSGRFGIHAALWHDRFGHPVSHGCINLSPVDAERLFRFTGPALPPGWHALSTDAGTRVVVRR